MQSARRRREPRGAPASARVARLNRRDPVIRRGGPGCDALEPPSQSDVDAVRRLDQAALIPLEYVVDLYGDVGLRIVSGTDDPRRSVELFQWQKALRHSVLRIEIFIAQESDHVACRSGRPDAITRFAIE